METLLALDHQLFFLINDLPHTPLSDTIAFTISGIGVGGLIWLLLSVLIFVRVERRDHWFFLPVVLATAFSQFVTNMWLKYFFSRNRPPGAAMSDYSFPSGHATFAWALAVVLAHKQPRLKYAYFFLAVLISLSRIYLGKHYPADVIAGSVLGLGIGYFSLWIEKKLIYYRIRRRK